MEESMFADHARVLNNNPSKVHSLECLADWNVNAQFVCDELGID